MHCARALRFVRCQRDGSSASTLPSLFVSWLGNGGHCACAVSAAMTSLRPPRGARNVVTSSAHQAPSVRNYRLMDFPLITHPSPVKAIRNFILVNFIVRPYIDMNFSNDSFLDGVRQAIHVISSHLVAGKTDPLVGLMTDDALGEIRRNMARLDATIRHKIDLQCANFVSGFIYEVGLIMRDDEYERKRRWLEVTACAFFNRSLGSSSEPARGMLPFSKIDLNDVVVCNIRLIRNYSKDVHDSWTVNAINFFQPVVEP